MVSKIGTVHAHTVVCVYQGEDNANPHHQCKNCGVCSSTRRQRRLPSPPHTVVVFCRYPSAKNRGVRRKYRYNTHTILANADSLHQCRKSRRLSLYKTPNADWRSQGWLSSPIPKIMAFVPPRDAQRRLPPRTAVVVIADALFQELLTIGSYFYYYSQQFYLDLLFRKELVLKKSYKHGKIRENKEKKACVTTKIGSPFCSLRRF